MRYIDIFPFQYQLLVDRFAHQRCRTSQFEIQDFYGQLLRILIITVSESQDDQILPQTLVYALIKSVILINPTTDGIKYYEDFGPMEFVDLNQVKCVIERIMDRRRWAIVDRSTSSARIDVTI